MLMDVFLIPCNSFPSHLEIGNCCFKPCLCLNLCINFLIFFNFGLVYICRQYLKDNIIIMELRLWPENWESVTINFLVYYVQFSCNIFLQCVLHSHHPLLFGIYHCMQATDSVLCANHTCSISDIIVVITLCRFQSSQVGYMLWLFMAAITEKNYKL